MIKILYIDDCLGDLGLLEVYFQSNPNVKLTTLNDTPHIEVCADYDGIILDQNLSNGKKGLDYAAKIANFYDNMIPVMLYLGGEDQESKDSKSVVDCVCDKNDFMNFGLELNAFIRFNCFMNVPLRRRP